MHEIIQVNMMLQSIYVTNYFAVFFIVLVCNISDLENARQTNISSKKEFQFGAEYFFSFLNNLKPYLEQKGIWQLGMEVKTKAIPEDR